MGSQYPLYTSSITTDVTINGASPSKPAQPYKKMSRSMKPYSRLGQASQVRSQGPTIP